MEKEISVEELLKGCFINVDKPSGPTSHDVDLWFRRIFSVEKTSHFGTLDPAVTGVLPIAIGKAVKLFQYFQTGKEYVGVMRINEDVKVERVKEVIKEHFTGKIRQLPPKKSVVKRVEREREIYKFDILEKEGKNFLFYVSCEAGTYIRKLVHDLGEALGCGAHMTELRRTKAGRFEEKDSFRIEEILRAYEEHKKGNSKDLLKMLIQKELLLQEIKSFEANNETFDRIKHGGPIFMEDIDKKFKAEIDERIGILYQKEIVAIFKVIKEGKIFAKPDSVLVGY